MVIEGTRGTSTNAGVAKSPNGRCFMTTYRIAGNFRMVQIFSYFTHMRKLQLMKVFSGARVYTLRWLSTGIRTTCKPVNEGPNRCGPLSGTPSSAAIKGKSTENLLWPTTQQTIDPFLCKNSVQTEIFLGMWPTMADRPQDIYPSFWNHRVSVTLLGGMLYKGRIA